MASIHEHRATDHLQRKPQREVSTRWVRFTLDNGAVIDAGLSGDFGIEVRVVQGGTLVVLPAAANMVRIEARLSD